MRTRSVLTRLAVKLATQPEAKTRLMYVIPLTLPELTTVFAEDVPIFRGRYGQSNGRYAVRFKSQVGRRERPSLLDYSEEKVL